MRKPKANFLNKTLLIYYERGIPYGLAPHNCH